MGFLIASVVNFFEDSIRQFAVLAVFMPIVPLLGGNAGTQTLTVMVRGIALGELRWSNSRRALIKEVLVGAMNGIVIGLVVALAAVAWKGNPILGVVLALSMFGTLIMAAIAGTLVPLSIEMAKSGSGSGLIGFCDDVDGCHWILAVPRVGDEPPWPICLTEPVSLQLVGIGTGCRSPVICYARDGALGTMRRTNAPFG